MFFSYSSNAHSFSGDSCIMFWAGFSCMFAPKSQIICEVKFENKTPRKIFLKEYKIKHDSSRKLKEA